MYSSVCQEPLALKSVGYFVCLRLFSRVCLDICHADLWLQCMSTPKLMQSPRWPCKHCSATNRYPTTVISCPNSLPTFTGGQQFTRGQPNSGNPWLIFCRDFNLSICRHLDCRFDHRCEYCKANHPGKDCRNQWQHRTTC